MFGPLDTPTNKSTTAIGYLCLITQINIWESWNDIQYIYLTWIITHGFQYKVNEILPWLYSIIHMLWSFTLTCSLTQCGRCDVDMVLIPWLVLKFHTTCLWKWDPAVPAGGDLKLGVVSEVFTTNTSSVDWSDLFIHLLQRCLTGNVVITKVSNIEVKYI